MKHYHTTNDDDFEIINGKKILRDGRVYRRSMYLMDGGSRTDDRGPMRITDAAGNGGLALNRPGYRCLLEDDAGIHAKAEAQRQYLKDLQNAWRGDAGNEGMVEGAACIVRNAEYPNDQGMPGHVRRIGGRLICVPDAPKASGNDAMPVSDIETAYRLYSEEISQAWRIPR
jgi:hypothetical protein